MTTAPNPAPKHPNKPPVVAKEKSPAVISMGWLHTAKFLTTAPQLHFLPELEVPEIAFVGRSWLLLLRDPGEPNTLIYFPWANKA